MFTDSVLSQPLKNLKFIPGFEGIETIADFRAIFIARARWSDLEYTSSLEIQYFTYYVVLIEVHGHRGVDIAVLKHEAFHPNRKILINDKIGVEPAGMHSNNKDFCGEVNNIAEANNGVVLDGALVNRLKSLNSYYKEIKKAVNFHSKLALEKKLNDENPRLKKGGNFTLHGIHEEAFNYFRFGKSPLWHENFIQELREREIEENRRMNNYYENYDDIEEYIREINQGYESDGQWFYPGDYPEDSVPD